MPLEEDDDATSALASVQTLRRLLLNPPSFGGDQVDGGEDDAEDADGDRAAAADADAAAADDADDLPTTCRPVATRHASRLACDAFVRDFMAPNRPVLIVGAARGWRAAEDWVRADADGGVVDVDALVRAFGANAPASVAECAALAGAAAPAPATTAGAAPRRGDDGASLGQFAARWRAAAAAAGGGGDRALPYLKDFHLCYTGAGADDDANGAAGRAPDGAAAPFAAARPRRASASAFYPTPALFRDDWLNGHLDALARARPASPPDDDPHAAAATAATSDYRFLYAGLPGTWTPCHADVLRSFSWSANLSGRKRWWLLPPRATGGALLLRRERGLGGRGWGSSSGQALGGGARAGTERDEGEEGEGEGEGEEDEARRRDQSGDDGGAAAAAEHALPPHFFLAARPGAARTPAAREFLGRAAAVARRRGERQGGGAGTGGDGDGGDGDDNKSNYDATAARRLRAAVLAARPVVVDQRAGDALFVPAGWHHVVENVADDEDGGGRATGGGGGAPGGGNGGGGVLSINHNWVNAHSAHWSLRLLRATRRAAARHLAAGRCRETARGGGGREFEGLVQRLLLADAGMDYARFAAMAGWAAGRAAAGLRGGRGAGDRGGGEEGGGGGGGGGALGALAERRRLSRLLDLQRAAALLEAAASASKRADEENWAWLVAHPLRPSGRAGDGGGRKGWAAAASTSAAAEEEDEAPQEEQERPPAEPESWALKAEALARDARALMVEEGIVPLEPSELPVYGDPPLISSEEEDE